MQSVTARKAGFAKPTWMERRATSCTPGHRHEEMRTVQTRQGRAPPGWLAAAAAASGRCGGGRCDGKDSDGTHRRLRASLD